MTINSGFAIACICYTVIGSAACSGAGERNRSTAGTTAGVGSRLNAGPLQLLDGRSRPLVTPSHRATVLAFWATWCQYCKEEIPRLSRIQAGEGLEGIEVVGVNAGEGPKRIRTFLEDNPMPYPVAVDPGQTLMGRFGIQAVPAVVMIDREGTIKFIGDRLPDDPNGLEATLSAVLNAQDGNR